MSETTHLTYSVNDWLYDVASEWSRHLLPDTERSDAHKRVLSIMKRQTCDLLGVTYDHARKYQLVRPARELSIIQLERLKNFFGTPFPAQLHEYNFCAEELPEQTMDILLQELGLKEIPPFKGYQEPEPQP